MKKLNDTSFEAPFIPVTKKLEELAAKYPERTAVIGGGERVSYAHFNEQVNRAANALLALDVGRETPVAVMMDRGINAYIAHQAILKAGGAFLSVSPEYPEDRVRFILEDSGAKYVIADERAGRILASFGELPSCAVLSIDSLLACQNTENPDVAISERDLCYCIYTSGSTGRPKGVMLEHGNLSNFVNPHPKNRETAMIVENATVTLALASLTFDVSVMEEFIPLTNGLTAVIATEEELHDLRKLSALMAESGVDGLATTPSFLSLMLSVEDMRKALRHVRVFDIGAEAFLPGLYQKIMDAAPDALVLNGYGPTETTISCTMKVITGDENITIGVPNGNVFAYIIDENNREVPRGETGELLICGKGVGRGYINLPERSAEAFIEFNGMRGYKTGDLARITMDGEIEFHGRRDNQVKLRGLRIELGEIEEVLLSCPGVTNAAVTAVDNSYLCAYYTASRKISPDELTDYAAGRLACYMVPDVMLQLDEMPLTDNQKIDRKRLPKPVMKQDSTDVPKNRLEQTIHDIVAEVTGNANFGIHTPFERAGLSSLGAMALNVKLADRFGIVIKTGDIHRYNTVVLLEDFLSRAEKPEETEIRECYPLTGSQKGIFAECLKNPESTVYNIPFLFTLDRGIDVARLTEALKETLAAHPYMNARFGLSPDGEMIQKPCDEAFEPELISLTEEEFRAQRDGLVRPFHLEGGRLFVLKLFVTEKNIYLLVDFHHIMADGNSYDIFFEDLDRAYRGEKPEPERYSGFAAALGEEKDIAGGRFAEAAKYYDRVFSGLDVESLPIPDRKGDRAAKGLLNRNLDISEEKVLKLCERFSVTPNVLFTGVFGILAARFANTREALFATIYNGRNDSRLAHTVCMLVKTLPVYTRFDQQTLLSAYMSELQQQLMDSMAHDIYPFSDISAKYGVSADLIFAYQAELSDDYPIGEFTARGEDLSLDLPKEPLLLQIRLRRGRYVIEAEYRADQYTERFIENILSSYNAAMNSAAVEKFAADVTVLDEAQRRELDAWNETDADYPEDRTVAGLFLEAAAAYPDKTAVVSSNVRLSYARLEALSGKLAGYLHARGIGREDAVALLIPRCEYMAVCALGAVRAGCAYQPLDPSYPEDRLAFMVRDSAAKLLVTTREMRALLPAYAGEVLYVDEIAGLPAYTEALPEPKPEDLFILLYTSGSTGVPKGCMLSFGNITDFCHMYHEKFGLDSASKITAYASFGFDASMMDLFPALTCGAEVHVIPEEIRLDLVALNKYFEENGITHAFMTTQVARQFAINVENRSLRYLMTGGEKLVPLKPPSNYKLVNIYGPTETTVFVTSQIVDRYYDDIPIGLPNQNVRLYITDDRGHRLPPGACGELLVAGPQVSRGYLNQPEKTAEAYIANPYTADEKYGKIYRTGDVVRFLSDGCVAYIGRHDMQVKIRGFRIELTEIEEIIRRFPGIKDATVAAFDNPGEGKYVAAYVVSDEKVDVDALNAFIASEKPAYMVPSVTMQIDAIPLNQNQKVNRRALPKPERKVEQLVAPKTRMQQKIFDCAAEAVGHRDFGVTTDLYSAGLTSISAIQLNVLLAKTFDAVIRTSDLKEHPTVEQLESFLLATVKTAVHEKQADYPLTPSQEGVFIDSMANSGSTVYNIPFFFKLSPAVDLKKLKKALEQAVEAHPYLKVRLFMNEKGEIRQRREDDAAFSVPIYNELDRDKLVRPFNLLNESLLRIELYRNFDGNYLFMDLHHIIADGSTLQILLADVEKAYRGETLEPESYSSYDLALDCAEAKKSGAMSEAEAFFDGIFADCGGNTDVYPDKNENTPRIGNLDVLSKAMAPEAVQRLCTKYAITENVFFVAAFGLMLSRYQFGDHAVFTTIYHGRNDSRLTGIAGMLVKTLPVLCRPGDDLAAYLKAVQEELMGMMDHDLFPFAEISKKYAIRPNMMLVYQGASFRYDRICGEAAEEIPLALNAAKAPVSLMITLTEEGYYLELEYRRDLYHEESMQYLIANLEQTVTALLAEKAPDTLRLPFDEKEEMVDDPRFTGRTFVDCFNLAAAKYPDNLAVKDEFGGITYRELDRASDLVAEKLTRNDFGVEQVAGILCGRTKEFVIAVIGVMKAGGAYVPLDPEYPAERLEYMLTDSGSANLLAMKELLPLVDFYSGNIITLDAAAEESRNFVKTADFAHAKPENLAYMIYTSGSTGKPKGVMLEHRNLMNLMMDIFLAHEPTEKDMFAEHASFCFDASVHSLFIPFVVGASLYIFPERVRKDVLAIADTLKKEPITVTTMPTQMGELVIQTLTEGSRLRLITLGGEKFKRFYDRPFTMVNGYGPTENTVSSTEFIVDREYDNIPIGKAQTNVRCYIVDENMKRVPVGVPGELCLAGRQVARGYHNLPEKTASAFVPNPFARSGEEARLYRTGDMVRMKGDGNIEFVGRIDSQVKIRGFRVELGEIEGAVLKAAGVEEAAAAAPELNGVRSIAVYYTGKAYTDDEWKAFLRPLLPDYMIPSFFIRLDRMPLTPGGKIDKRALPVPEAPEKAYTAPRNEKEEALCEIFAKALGVEKIGIDDNFFDQGGSSLSASMVAVMCMTEGIPLVYADIFQNPTVRKLCAVLYSADAAEESKEAAEKNAYADYDYHRIDGVLAANDRRNADRVKSGELGDILLTGATGFLGIHILKAFLDQHSGKVYCLVRKGSYESPEKRLMHMLMYYFGDPHIHAFGERIVCIDGDITDPDEVMGLQKVAFNTLINCAACVKHFAVGDILDKINLHGVENLIALCKATGRRLIQISTVSVAGEGMHNCPPADRKITEKDLFFGQRITNAYIRSKFLAERAVLEAVADGLDAKIIRAGNLMSRASDGEFQINFITNGFLRTLRGYAAVGAFPISGMGESAEYSPIDSTAEAVLALSATNSEFTVFHATNNHRIFMSDVIRAMNRHGIAIRVVPDGEFEKAVNDYAAAHEDSDAVSGLIAYISHDEGEIYTIDYSNAFTIDILYRLGYLWPITDNEYLEHAIAVLDGMEFFQDGYEKKEKERQA